MNSLLNEKLADGSRIFCRSPRKPEKLKNDIDWFTFYLKEYVKATVEKIISDNATQAVLPFTALGHKFQLAFEYSAWELIAENTDCPENILQKMAEIFADMLEPLRYHAKGAGPLGENMLFRVMTSEGGKISHYDFDNLEKARSYARDAQWEVDPEPVVAVIFDKNFSKIE